MTPEDVVIQVVGIVGAVLATAALLALFIIGYSRAVDRAVAWWHERRAARSGLETASTQERRAARDLGYEISGHDRGRWA